MPPVQVLLIAASGASRAAVQGAAEASSARVTMAETVTSGLRLLSTKQWDLVLMSLDAPGGGLELARRVCGEARAGRLILFTAEGSAQRALDAVNAGASDLLVEPLDVGKLEEMMSKGGAGMGDVIPLPEWNGSDQEMVGRSPELMEVYKVVGRVASSGATVLVTGESGTGKELVARAIHRTSTRAAGPFVTVNCAAIPEDLLESELFGHERGAFTGAVARKIGRFERAEGGTIFLDEIGDMSLVLQAKILRVLQEREIERVGGEERIPVDVRIVAATHRNLDELIKEGEFREDLFYRLAVIRLHLPPLRERGDDVRVLALHFAAEFAGKYRPQLRGISAAVLEELVGYHWPGNVRELRNVMEREVLMAGGDVLQSVGLSTAAEAASRGGSMRSTVPGYSPSLSISEVEALHIARVLDHVGGHLGRAAEILGLHRNTVSRKAQEYGIIGHD